jgi:ABC-2 type transport system permease protein
MKIFWSFAVQAWHTSAIYRFDFWLRVFNTFLMMYTVHWLWRALYAQQTTVFEVSLPQMITYAVLAMIVDTASRPGNWTQYYMMEKVRTGEISMDLLKPLDFHLHMLARNVGEMLFYSLVLGLPCYLIGVLFLGLRLPPDVWTGLLFLVSFLLGYLVTFSLSFLIGLISIYTLKIENIGWAYNAVVRFFSGQMVPLWLFPTFLAQIAGLLPFQCMFAIPLSIYIGKLSPSELSSALLLQCFWVLALVLSGRLIWSRAQAHLIVQGG